jgi:D-lyxose ketol-isomerase
MLSQSEYIHAQAKAAKLIKRAGLRVTKKEEAAIEVADFGLSRLEKVGVQILNWVATERIGVKILVLFPQQIMPEHWHPPVGSDPGKEETLRLIAGAVSFYQGARKRMRMTMKADSQVTIAPGTRHWFRAGKEGAVMFSFSTIARDALDVFTNPKVIRATKIAKSGPKR